jgi:hypothetical protein
MKKILGLVIAVAVIVGAGIFLYANGTLSELLPNVFPVDNSSQPHKPVKRVDFDQNDSITGFQVKVIVLLPRDAKDNNDDTNGLIAKFINEGNANLQARLGKTLAIDSVGDTYDFQFMKSSHTSAEFSEGDIDPYNLGLDTQVLLKPRANRKDYIFFIPVDHFKSGEACGTGTKNLPAAIVAYADGCGAQAASTWVHELLHNLGVNHVSAQCDLMNTTGGCGNNTPEVDTERKLYVGAAQAGVDILPLRVWAGATARSSGKVSHCDLYSHDLPAGVERFATCPTGKQAVGDPFLCWHDVPSSYLQQWSDAKGWFTIATGTTSHNGWNSPSGTVCPNYGVRAMVTVNSAGPISYRWVTNGKGGKKWWIFWQN